MTSEIKDNVWFVDGEPFTLISGAYHYFRIPRDLWEQSLTLLKDAELNSISTYIPWIGMRLVKVNLILKETPSLREILLNLSQSLND